MNANELVRRIDESIETGMGILASRAGDGADRREVSDTIKMFRRGVKDLIEAIYGGSHQLSRKFEDLDANGPALVEEGLAALRDLRRLAVYSGEFSS